MPIKIGILSLCLTGNLFLSSTFLFLLVLTQGYDFIDCFLFCFFLERGRKREEKERKT